MSEWFEKECIGDLPAKAARQWGKRDALVFEGERSSFEDFNRSVDDVAKGLIALGIGPGDKVALWYPNRPGWLHAFFAILKVGGIVVPLNTRLRVEDAAYAIEAADVSALMIADRAGPMDFLDMTREILSREGGPLTSRNACRLEPHRVVVDGEIVDDVMTSWKELLKIGTAVRGEDLARRAGIVNPDRAAMMLFTSGSTGNPKGVVHSHNPIRNVTDEVNRMGICESDTILMYLPLFHSLGLYEGVLTMMVAGTRMVLQERFDPDESIRLIEKERCTLMHGFDTHFREILNSPEMAHRDTSSLRTGILAAGMVSTERVARETQRRLMKAVSGWGMTEIGCGALLGSLSDDEEARCLGSGHPLPGYEFRISDLDAGCVRTDYGFGELQVRSYQMFMGYYENPVATADSFTRDGWFRTGDQACWREDGSIRFVGRYKDMLKVGGENVDPFEVEAFLSKHPTVDEVQIVGVHDDRLGEVPVACIVAKPGQAQDEAGVLEYCKGRIASFKIPRYVVFLKEFPMTPSGKVQRYLLREHVSKELEGMV